ncbi:Putative glycosyltransferase EpsH [Roseimaritima multifibrata]|uniref:Glycosyltransferase EpsH n=1 Tax=Roseimaritima multifibrata TaxID=1930274 RepID=A0A517MN80_9BACT|nr:glycosyltransferase family 2 protein [Roseimaritima multifibrata]QDS96348.1 Putative glycosyltransferase EpsH [Roseimaritima multifibrata]
MNDEQAVSLVIPTYNAGQALLGTVQSALRQTRPPDQIVVVDDGSTDGSVEALGSFGAEVRVIRQGNRGAAVARYRGVEASDCDLVAFADADDPPMPPNRIADLVDALLQNPECVLAYGMTWDMKLTEPRVAPGFADLKQGEYFVVQDALQRMLTQGWPLASAMNLVSYRSLLLKQIRDRQFYAAANDYDLQMRMAVCGPFVYVASVTAFYQEGGAGISATYGATIQRAYALASAAEVYSKLRSDGGVSLEAWRQRVRNDWPAVAPLLVRRGNWPLLMRILRTGLCYGLWPGLPRRLWWGVSESLGR